MASQISSSLAAVIRGHALKRGQRAAFIEPERQFSWREYDSESDQLARRLLAAGLEPGARVGVYLPDSIELHVALLAVEKAGLVALGVGSRAGLRELGHLLSVAGAAALITRSTHREREMRAVFEELRRDLAPLQTHIVLDDSGHDMGGHATEQELPGRAVDDVFLLNSTSGTTGMPKCVVHDQARWYAFHREAVAAARLGDEEVFLGAAPPPFGFGLWTTHITPALLGATTVILPQFDARRALALIEEHRVTVLAAVSTQFVMMLNEPELQHTDFSSLRVMFTGGEMVPYDRALDFERRTGASVLQFYGSNETGAFSRTTVEDPVEKRLTTAGRLIESMEVRLFDDAGNDITAGGQGQPGGRGPLLSRGYYNDPEANAQLYTADGFMLMEDIVTLDAEGYLRVSGRKGDFVIRGGKNISCAAVEQAAATHPDIALAVAVGVPDPVMGERTLLFATTRSGNALSLTELCSHLERENVSRELFPEYLLIVEDIPRSSGGKVAKGVLREQAQAHVAGQLEAGSDQPG